MAKSLSKVIYKPDSQSTEEYTVVVNPEEYAKWKAGDTTIPLVEVVDSFQVFHSTQGSQGILGTASKQQLDTVFGKNKDVDVVEYILKNGSQQAGESIQAGNQFGSRNLANGSFVEHGGR
ncbi:ribosome maturation protein [Coprinopsis sp. MPI-PUGE-AT-0042]|nr:ribosome maturation protein [Coprinopsis sp. MPI-PUGE-AT-0042]